MALKGWEEKIRKDHIKALDKGDLVLIIFDYVDIHVHRVNLWGGGKHPQKIWVGG
jgi:hypothetical protein